MAKSSPAGLGSIRGAPTFSRDGYRRFSNAAAAVISFLLSTHARIRLVALGALASQAAFAEGWGGSLGATSDYVYRGVSLSDNRPSAQGDLHYYGAIGWFAGLSAASVKRDPNSSTSAELNPYLGYSRRFANLWTSTLSLAHYDYPGISPHRQYSYDELLGTLAYSDRISLTIAASPDTPLESTRGRATGRAALSYDLGLHQPLPHAFSANAGIGYYDLRWLVDTGYAYWNVGLAYDLGNIQLDLSYIGTGETAKTLFYDGVARNRAVVSVLWHF